MEGHGFSGSEPARIANPRQQGGFLACFVGTHWLPIKKGHPNNHWPKTSKTFDKCIENRPGCLSTGNTRWVLQTAHIPIY